MGSIDNISTLDSSIDEQKFYPPRHQDQVYVPQNASVLPPVELETPVLVAGGGPVGMYQSLMLARHHKQPCMLVEQYPTTTIYPKMEFTNGRSLEILRQIGIADQLIALGVPTNYSLDEIISTGLGPEVAS